MAARRTAAAGRPAALATASAITPASAPWRSSPPSSRRRNSCSVSVAAANRPAEQLGAPGLRALARDGADLGERRVDGRHRQRRLRRRIGQRAQRRPADADLALRQLPGQPGHHDATSRGSPTAASAARRSAPPWPAATTSPSHRRRPPRHRQATCLQVGTAPPTTSPRQPTSKDTEGQPVAPSGAGGAWSSVCTAPVLSVARAVMVWVPGWVAFHGKLHSRQVSLE